ncbi:hypothetical protein B0A50_00124 [Salinomyces thailandicus]|uniref:Proteophosphoglycan ppg4 n=1 Tax=Salinomyces thailandicus TaxID=706561 RepID=A0A4U0UFC0_9PEZI|nr:hypothetical protein B0A50_00124 [Salinomyces thailandica]
MATWHPTTSSLPLPLLLFLLPPASAIKDLWKVSIDNGPAPAPADGPPISASASRDRAILPYQIIGIVGAYLFVACFLLTLLLTIGRRLRHHALSTSYRRPTEMVKPMGRAFDPSPVSLFSSSARSWRSPRRLRDKQSAAGSVRSGMSGTGAGTVSPAMESVVSFDATVIEADRAQRQDEMERLYAAVMAQDDRKSPVAATSAFGKGVTVSTSEVDLRTAPSEWNREARARARAPPRLVTDAPNLRHLQVEPAQWSPRSPGTPKSPVRAIYPPDSSMPPMPSSPTSPVGAEYPTTPLTPRFSDQFHYPQRRVPSGGSFSSNSLPSNPSPSPPSRRSKKTPALRHLKISPPFALPDADNSDGARTPLSPQPRVYPDPGLPPPPRLPSKASLENPFAPAATSNWPFAADEASARVNEVRDIPQPYPSRRSGGVGLDPPPISTKDWSRQDKQENFSISPSSTSAADPKGQLPFRQHQTPDSTSAPWSSNRSAAAPPALKTTLLPPRRDGLSAAAPWTGVAVPYSPYMPFTPVTPVCARLVGRRETEANERERVVEMVEDEEEVWGGAY